MAEPTEIASLSGFINSYVADLDAHLSGKGLSSPSFSLDALPALPLSPELAFRREKALAAIDDLKALIEGPQANLSSVLSTRAGVSIGLQALARYGILNHIRIGEELGFDELAHRAQLDVSNLRRVMRSLIAVRLFCEPRKGFVAHSSTSKILIEHPLTYRWLEFTYEEIWPSTTSAVDAMFKWAGSEEPNQTGFSLSRNQTESFWDTVPPNPARSARFSDAMQFLFSAPAFSSAHLIRNLDWSQDDSPKTVVDVGGSSGVIATQLLQSFPSLEKVIVQDLPGVIGEACVPPDLDGRLELTTHNFLEPQTVTADAYLLRLVLHDWSDKYAAIIIRNLIPSLKRGAKIIVNDMCLPEPGHLSKFHEQIMRDFDLVMKANFNSKERDADEWIALFSSCDSRFESTSIKKTPGSPLAVMEFVWNTA